MLSGIYDQEALGERPVSPGGPGEETAREAAQEVLGGIYAAEVEEPPKPPEEVNLREVDGEAVQEVLREVYAAAAA